MNKIDPLVLVFERNAFYKRLYYRALGVFALSILVIGLLIWVFAYLSHNPRPPLYFATDKVGRLVDTLPVSRPNMTEEEVVSWAIEAVEAAFSYDFVNYRAQLQAAQKYFTNYGWRNYMNALTESNNLVALKQRRMVVSAKVIYQPELVTRGLLAGAYAWKYQMHLLVTYMQPPYDGASTFTNPIDVSVIVQRQPELQSYKGLAVLQAVGQFATRAPTKARPITLTPT